ncbi:MAG: response regulator [Mediterranea sp.]|jgi:signal transduction histidine kinase/ligand-binding sensor domain-containing protein/DNA-binding response OmpR family regulator|nr:response regulator [Mediterranea sp.]
MKTRFLNITFSCLLLLISTFVHAKETYHFRILSPKGGFYYDGVVDINQDGDGFIWILLDNDLLRFDSHEYKRYSACFPNPENSREFRKLAVDSSGQLHVLTSEGLFIYNKRTDGFEKLIGVADISNLIIDRKDNIWCMSSGLLYRISPHEKYLIQCLYDGNTVKSISSADVDGDQIYFSSRYNRIYRCDSRNPEVVELFKLLPEDYAIVEIKKHEEHLYILTEKHGVVCINIATGEIDKQLPFQDGHENIPVKVLHIDKNSNVWIGTQRGLYLLDPATGKYRLYLHSESDPFSLPNNSIWVLFGDRHQNLWIGTYTGGLSYINLDETRWSKTYIPSATALNHNIVSSFAEDGNRLWIGTEGGGFSLLNKSTGVFTVYKNNGNSGSNTLSYNNVKSLALDSLKRLWIAMYRGGLDCFDTKTERFRHFRYISKNKEGLYNNDLRKIVLEKNAGLWIAYQAKRSLVSFLSFNDFKFTHHNLGEDEYVFDICKDSRDQLWVVTRKRLYRINTQDKSIKDVSPNKEVLNGQSLCVDAHDNIWIGTVGNGLLKYNPFTSEFSAYRSILNFNMSAVYSLCPDTLGCLWIGTDNGLFRYDIENDACQRFDAGDGFQGQVYYPLASLKGNFGELYFGGSNGFTVFNPYGIKFNTLKPKARISEFYIDNAPAILTSGVEHRPNGEILLNHDQANFGFKFSSDNYLSPDKNMFKYRLKGYDDRWTLTNASNRMAMYSKVPAGTYYFELLAANNDGVWNNDPVVVKIERKPALWFSWPAYLIYSIIVFGVVLVIFYHYNGKRKLRVQIYMESLDKQKKEELHQSQLRFFTNISHDFRTPLSLILGAVDNLKQEGLKEYYYRILHNNSRRLLNLVNELMDFRTVGNNKMKLRVQPVDVNRLVVNLASDFGDYARTRNIILRILCDPELPDNLYVDKQILEKVVMNLLNNAFKYMDDGGTVAIETYSVYSKFVPQYEYGYNVSANKTFNSEFLLVVRDTGVGISKDSIENVFERFYTVNTINLHQHLGTGIGLALVKSLMLLHKGTISIFSERGKGTEIAVYFPTDASVYDKSELAEGGKDTGKDIGINTGKDIETASNRVLPGKKDIDVIIGADSMYRCDRRRILIVEDNDDLRTLMSGFLSLHYEIVEAANGVEALQILKETEVNLILSDIMMPHKDGIALCREVKTDVNTSHIPVILLTAKSEPESRMEGADSGADMYFLKPIDFNLLLLSIQNMFKHQQNLREYYSKHYYAESAELSMNEQDNTFLKKLSRIIDTNLNQPNIDVNYIASELSMSRSKLYSKVKMLTGKSIVEFTLDYKMRKAARLIIEQDMSMHEVMIKIGIRSQSYFTSSFKQEFGETPSAFAAKHRKR